MKKIDVSVIIPLFNSEDWISECIDSVTSQMQDIELEIVVVDDGSSDNSVEIVQAYCNQYQNIQLYIQTHGRQGKARNTGLSDAKGEYIVFLDADDVLQPGALKRFLAMATKDQCDFVVGVAQSFNDKQKTWINEGYQSYTSNISNTDIDKFPEFLLDPSSCNKMYRASFLKKHRIVFPENTYCEDVGFIYAAYILADKISILPEVFHLYRARGNKGKLSGTQTFSEERLSQCADVYAACIDQYQSIGTRANNELLQARAIIRFKRFFYRIKVFPDSTSYMYEVLESFFSRISPTIIAENADRFAIPFFMIRQGFFAHAVALLKSPDNKSALCDFFRVLSTQNAELSSLFFAHFIIYPEHSQNTPARTENKSTVASVLHAVKNVLSFFVLSSLSRKMLQSKINSIRNHIWGGLLYIWFFVARRFLNQNIWLVGERNGKGAEENGYIFFKYCQNNGNGDHVYYVVEKAYYNSEKLSNEKNILIKGSYRHLFLFGLATCAIFNNDIWDICPNISPSLVPDVKKIFLTHGIKLYGPGVYMRNRANDFDAILVSSEMEKQTVKYEWNIRQPSKLKVTGLPRFDNLLDSKPKKEILFCPTWRKSLTKLNHDQFMDSSFFNAIADFLTNEQLLSFLRLQGVMLVIRLHFNLEKHIACFQRFLNEHISIEDSKTNRNLQQALVEAKLLITDYSSILWDMAYMHRPVILYQFDREAFLAERGLHAFGIEESQMKFARMAKTSDNVIDHLQKISNHEFTLTQDEVGNADGFFAFRDSNNCDRLYNYLSSK